MNASLSQATYLELHCPAFAPDGSIPRRYTADGENFSPPLTWTLVPSCAKSLAILCEDPDAHTPKPWVHWIIFNLPPFLVSLPEGIRRLRRPPAWPGAIQGLNSWQENNVGYRGPAPTHGDGPHHYHFKLFALDEVLPLSPRTQRQDLLRAIRGHEVARAEVVGTYQRPSSARLKVFRASM